MEVIIKREIIEKLSSKGVLAYVAVMLAEGTESTTAVLAGLVRCQTAIMLEGIKELCVEAPELIRKPSGKGLKWSCGVVKAGDGVIVQKDSDRYRLFVDDLKKYWDFLNPDLPFEMGGKDGKQIRQFLSDHRQWAQDDWRIALQHRKTSILKFNHAPRTQPFWIWIGGLDNYAAGPINGFNRPAEGASKHGETEDIRKRNREAVQRAVSNA